MHLMCTAIPSFPCLLCFMVISFSILCIFSYFLFVSNLSLTETNEILGFVAVLHYFLSPIFVAHGFIPVLLSNLLFLVAASYYHYLNFLGYDVLPFLERTTFFLYPIGMVIVLSPILTLSGFNPSRYFMNLYFSQRL
uniref:Protein unc-50 homolog n=1 Tax=Rhizophora mucronata TaxID=61149 RepID=A0A2P2LBW2_RHIMU